MSIGENVQKYKAFIAEVLQPRLTEAMSRHDFFNKELREFCDLEAKLTSLLSTFPSEYQTVADIGEGYQVDAIIAPSPDSIFINLGLGIFVDQTYLEAVPNVRERKRILSVKIDLCQTEIMTIQADLLQVNLFSMCCFIFKYLSNN